MVIVKESILIDFLGPMIGIQQVLQVSGIMQWNAITTYTITAPIVVTAVGDAAVAEESAV